MYRVASKGVVSGIASGNAFVFLKAVDTLTKKFPDYVSTTVHTHTYISQCLYICCFASY
jgi:hypothetical protein